ncbi:MAG: hypothetical protein B6U88_00870 [Candidatus Aenigmarchaeota archaeon ex4484_56]|nr:MAG: hypothetical protein B6U88_00870 [Candidatus Aenigmarchaeota archaeon ex4484_56]
MRNSSIINAGVQYAVAVENLTGIKTRTVFSSIVGDDGLPHSSLLALRSQTLNVCIHMGDWSWQVISLLVERSLWPMKFKKDLVKLSLKYKIPLEKTRSCTRAYSKHCGKCTECLSRKKAFKEAGVKDKTEYLN